MVDVQNTEVIDRISQDIKESNLNTLPKTLNNSVQPILIINPLERTNPVHASGNASTTGTVTIFTTPSSRDFYITSIALAFTADATSDSTSVLVSGQIHGQAATTLLVLRKAATVANNQSLSVSFPVPLRMERGTTITTTSAFTVGAQTSTTSISGFTVDTLQK